MKLSSISDTKAKKAIITITGLIFAIKTLHSIGKRRHKDPEKLEGFAFVSDYYRRRYLRLRYKLLPLPSLVAISIALSIWVKKTFLVTVGNHDLTVPLWTLLVAGITLLFIRWSPIPKDKTAPSKRWVNAYLSHLNSSE